MKKQAVLFDLDGTLLDTLQDLHHSVLYLLDCLSLPPVTLMQTRQFVGNGIEMLLRRALQAARPGEVTPTQMAQALSLYLPHYAKHGSERTAPYNGVLPLLRFLRERGVKTAVVSNKNDEPVRNLCARYFPNLLDFTVGVRAETPPKPAPDCVTQALEYLGVSPEDALYVGDSEVDAATAAGAGLPFIGVTWGFRDEQTLRDAGANVLCADASELRGQLERLLA